MIIGANQLGMAAAYIYKCDDLDRLTGAASVWDNQPVRTECFTLAMSCDSIYDIAVKEQRHIRTPSEARLISGAPLMTGRTPRGRPSLIGDCSFS